MYRHPNFYRLKVMLRGAQRALSRSRSYAYSSTLGELSPYSPSVRGQVIGEIPVQESGMVELPKKSPG